MTTYYDKRTKINLLVSQRDIEGFLLELTDEDCVGVLLEVIYMNPNVEKILRKRMKEEEDV